MKLKHLWALLLFCANFFFTEEVMCESYFVANRTELNQAVSIAQPGDSIVIKNNIWRGVDFVLTCNGTENNPITLCAETPGKVYLEDGSRIAIGGDHLVVSGFKIQNGSNENNAVVFEAGGKKAKYCRLTNCMIDDWGPSHSSTKIHWVVLSGAYNRIDHCQFSNMNHPGVTILVKAGADQTGHHQIDHNLFGPKPEGEGNGYESIKMGSGKVSMFSLNTVVEKNYFTKCNGEVELISNKSWENTYRYNTFYECQGTITLRWGRKCIVEGNYFFGNGEAETGGIRITDQDHLIVNNYFENLTGDDARAAISIMSGIPDVEGGDSGHGQTKNVHILHNTIVNCKESINIGYYDKDDLGDPRGDLEAPEDCTIANNIIWSEQGQLIKEDWAPAKGIKWFGNLAYGAKLGLDPNEGLMAKDPGLERSNPSDIWRIMSSSPAVDAGVVIDNPVLKDFEQQERNDGLPDIGADEFSKESASGLPVSSEDVGPSWLQEEEVITDLSANILQTEFKIAPNPVINELSVVINHPRKSHLTIELFDMSGTRRSMIYNQIIDSGQWEFKSNVANLPSGIYVIDMILDYSIHHREKLIIQ